MTIALNRREQILVVEDDLDSGQVIGEVLQKAGHLVALAANGLDALQLSARGRPDLVLSDLQMPGLSGIEFIRRLHTFAPTIPVVLMTGLGDTKNLLTATAQYGAVACLKKPMNLDDLLWTIDSALAVARQRHGQQRHPTAAPQPEAAARAPRPGYMQLVPSAPDRR